MLHIFRFDIEFSPFTEHEYSPLSYDKLTILNVKAKT